MADGEVIYEIRGDDSKLDKDLADSESKVKKSASKLGNIAKGAGKVAGASALAVGTACVGAGVAAVNLANDMDSAVNGIIAATGEGAESAEKYQSVIEGIYKNNYGEGFDDIAQSVANVKQQMGDISDAELQNVVEKGYLMADTFGIEMNESLRGVNAMMNQFGISSEEAYELMAQGAQNGLNQNGDLADQLAEYSVYYADLGYSAEEMFNMLANGAEDGAYQIDYLNDAMKEFGIRSKDGSKASSEAFKALGLSADDMTKAFANGGEESQKAFSKVVKALEDCDDKVLQNQTGVALFGTKWEDLGVDAVKALTNTNGEIDKTQGKLGDMENIKYSSLGDMFEGLKRSVELLLIPLGEQLIPILSDIIETIMPIIEELLPPILEFIEKLLPPLLEIIETILPPAIELLGLLIESIMPLVEELMPVIFDILNQLLPPLMDILNAILPPLIDILMILLEPLLDLIKIILPPLVDLLNTIAPLFDALSPILKAIAKVLTAVLGPAFSITEGGIKSLSNIVGGTIKMFKGLLDFITGIFTGNWKKAWGGIKDAFSGVFSSLSSIAKAPINLIIDSLNGFINGINKIKIPDWVPGVGGKGINIPNIPRLKVGMDYVPDDDFPAFLHRGEAVLTASEADIYRQLGGKGSLEAMLTTQTAPVSYGGTQTIVITSPVYLDGKKISTSVTNNQYDDMLTRRVR